MDNIEPEAENKNPVCFIWDHIDQLRELPQVTEEESDQEHVVLLTSEQEPAKEVTNAKKRERKNMKIYGVYECVPDIGQKCISTKKFKDKRKIMKAHLIAHGYEGDSHDLKTDSQTCSHEAMCIVMLTALVMK